VASHVACFLPSLLFSVAVNADRHELALGNTFVAKEGVVPPRSDVDPKVWFLQLVFTAAVGDVLGVYLEIGTHSCGFQLF